MSDTTQNHSQTGIIGDYAHVEGGIHFHREVIVYEGVKRISAGDLLDACQAQVGSILYDARHKYNPDLYVNRAIEQELSDFFDSSLEGNAPNCFLIVAPAGSGKTNLLCDLARRRVTQQPVLLLLGGNTYLGGNTGLPGALQVELESASETMAFRSSGDCLHALHRLAEEMEHDTLVFLDAINEHDHPVAMRQAVEDLLRKTRGKRIKLVITCRDYYWGLFKGDFWEGATINALPAEIDEGEETADSELTDFSHFAANEHERALALYLEYYGITGRPVGNAAEQCRHPLLLRFFCEAYRGQDVGETEDIRLKELFDRYWEQKLASIANRMIKQGTERLQDGLADEVGDYLLNVAAHMLHNNTRAIPLAEIAPATQHHERYDDPRSLYGRVRDEFIILEERQQSKRRREEIQVAFVYEEFMEYVMARALIRDWDRARLDEAIILTAIKGLTKKYAEFAQILGVMVYLALMLKEEHDLALWSLLLEQGSWWQQTVFEAFRKLPEDQLDSRVADAIEQMLRREHEGVQEQVLDLLKLRRIGVAVSTSAAVVNLVCDLARRRKESLARRAVLALGYMPSELTKTTLIQAIAHSQSSVRDNAVTALGLQQQPVVDLLAAALADGDKPLQLGAIRALEHRADAQSTELLIAALEHPDREIRSEAARALGGMGGTQAVEPLIVALKDTDKTVQRQIVQSLGRLGDAKAIQPLVSTLNHSDLKMSRMVIDALRALGAAAPLLNILEDRTSRVRIDAIRALRRLIPASSQVVDSLIATLRDPDKHVRYEAAQTLVSLYVKDVRVVKILLEGLKNDDKFARQNAINSLRNLGELITEPISAFLRDGDREIQYEVAGLLVGLSWDSSDAVLMAWHRVVNVRNCRAAASLGDAAVEPLIATLLYSDDSGLRRDAVEALGELKDARATAPVLTALKTALKADDYSMQGVTRKALVTLGEAALEPLITTLLNDDSNMRREAARVLREIGATRAVEPLISALKDGDDGVRKEATRALGEIGDARALGPLVAALRDYDTLMSLITIESLVKFGEMALPPLVAALKNGDRWMRRSVVEALRQIGTPEALAAVREYEDRQC